MNTVMFIFIVGEINYEFIHLEARNVLMGVDLVYLAGR